MDGREDLAEVTRHLSGTRGNSLEDCRQCAWSIEKSLKKLDPDQMVNYHRAQG
jgi:hypothetical protein